MIGKALKSYYFVTSTIKISSCQFKVNPCSYVFFYRLFEQGENFNVR